MKKLLFLFIMLLIGCVHKPDIEQGNIVTSSQLSQLHIGMSEDAVKAILGTSVLNVPFNQNRLEYVYTLQKGRGEQTLKRLSLLFKDQVLVKIDSHY